jgi:hypothetical protein
MNVIKIENNGWVLEINLDGGRIVNLIKDNQKILGTFDRIDGKQGNTHICTPNFAAEGVEKFGFMFHGPFRNSEWQIIKQGQKNLEINCEIDGLVVIQKFQINDEFEQKIVIKNKSNERKRVNVAMHNYWDTAAGWQGIKLNGVDITEGIKNNPEIELKKENIFEIPGKKPVVWKVENFKLAKLWTGVKEENEIKFFDQNYVCIEPEMEFEGFVETEKSWLRVGGEIKLEQKINFK